jgi:hypothetical protein
LFLLVSRVEKLDSGCRTQCPTIFALIEIQWHIVSRTNRRAACDNVNRWSSAYRRSWSSCLAVILNVNLDSIGIVVPLWVGFDFVFSVVVRQKWLTRKINIAYRPL